MESTIAGLLGAAVARTFVAGTATSLLVAAGSAAQTPQRNLLDLSLEELGNLQITSVSRRAEQLADAPASVFVITGEDIWRTGVTSLPEALRLAPNLAVGRTYASGYSISARGFNNSAGNKVLVLIDGRTVYSPLFSGVFWDAQDVVLEDVDRIEVISGPAGTLWGTNAVNAVINVTTRSATETTGGLISAGGGSGESIAAIRYGGALGDDGGYRVYAKYVDLDHTSLADGGAVDDAGDRAQVGFRTDWSSGDSRFTVQGDVYSGDRAQPAPGTITLNGISRLNPISISGVNFLSRWAHDLEGGSNVTVQAYYDRTERNVRGTFDDTLDVVDVQFLHSLAPSAPHAAAWGADYRYGKDRVVNDDFIAFLPAEVDQAWASLFAQDEITLNDDTRLTLGARIERNDYTDYEFLPSARIAWNFAADHLLWAAVSRTVRAPSRIDRDLYFPADGPPFLLQGGEEFRSEIAQVYEVGYRGQLLPRVTYSATAYHADYDHLRTVEIAPSGTYIEFANQMEGTTSGVEMWVTYQSTANWRFGGGVTTLDKDLHLKPGSDGLNGGAAAEGNDPEYTWNLHSSHTLFERWELDVVVRAVDDLPLPAVPSYVALDLRIAWRSPRDFELSLTGQNLLDDGHAEFGDPLTRSEFEPLAFFEVIARF